MKILLDTQVFVWLVNDSPGLGRKSKKLVLSTQNQIYISFISFFEMTIRASLGKITFDPLIMQDLVKMGVVLLPGDCQSLSEYQVFNVNNKDPFDNFLIATAKAHKLSLLSSDQKIIETRATGLEILDAGK
ncbi:MAG: hypothetical protein COU69_04050 [Candidatus Pacebacteria bacterium CG10_big_fil_rev_8_21_14_0_10_56_10]|nr:MAG: hypothetical protein COU69_04050 [Candidatus Pacebacteria bacterium CG10_big_fil_rev_8_21_14_0_10_56_10]